MDTFRALKRLKLNFYASEIARNSAIKLLKRNMTLGVDYVAWGFPNIEDHHFRNVWMHCTPYFTPSIQIKCRKSQFYVKLWNRFEETTMHEMRRKENFSRKSCRLFLAMNIPWRFPSLGFLLKNREHLSCIQMWNQRLNDWTKKCSFYDIASCINKLLSSAEKQFSMSLSLT